MYRGIRSVVAAAALFAVPIGAAAQPPLPTRWDTGASFGFMWGDGFRQEELPHTNDEPSTAFQFDLGRYWTTHLKTEFAAILTSPRDQFVSSPVPGVPGGYTYGFTVHEADLTVFSGALAYQFFQNEMAHPFVAAGIQGGYWREHRHRNQETVTIDRVNYVVPAIDERSSDFLVRPFLSVGAKSYFNRQTFVRSELTTAVSSRGFSHASVRLGLGVDF